MYFCKIRPGELRRWDDDEKPQKVMQKEFKVWYFVKNRNQNLSPNIAGWGHNHTTHSPYIQELVHKPI
jgi:hypothetical protein